MSPRGRQQQRIRSAYNLDGDSPESRFEDWELDPELVARAVRKVLIQGDAILFRSTSDGGAVQVTIYSGDDEPLKRYCGSLGSLTSLLSRIAGSPLE